MARARCRQVITDASGNRILNASVYVYQPGTTTPIAETMYSGASGGGTAANPLTTDVNGAVEFYLAVPRVVDLKASRAGFVDLVLQNVQVAADATDSLPALLTTAGDIPYASGANTPARLAKGAVSTVLQVDASGVLKYDKVAAAMLAAEAWTDFTPTVTQSAAITITVNYARYAIVGKTALVQIYLTLSSAGTAGNIIQVASLPAAIAPKQYGGGNRLCGSAEYYDSGVGTYILGVEAASASIVRLMGAGPNANFFGVAPAVTIANTDQLSLNLAYEIA